MVKSTQEETRYTSKPRTKGQSSPASSPSWQTSVWIRREIAPVKTNTPVCHWRGGGRQTWRKMRDIPWEDEVKGKRGLTVCNSGIKRYLWPYAVYRPRVDPSKNVSLAAMQGTASGSNVRYYPTWKHSPLKERNEQVLLQCLNCPMFAVGQWITTSPYRRPVGSFPSTCMHCTPPALH
jgi:hypothetical protein